MTDYDPPSPHETSATSGPSVAGSYSGGPGRGGATPPASAPDRSASVHHGPSDLGDLFGRVNS